MKRTRLERRTALVTKKGLRRKADLKASSPLRRPEKPSLARGRRLAPRSATTASWDAWRHQEREAVWERAIPARMSLPRCEWQGCDEYGSEWHHTCGRRGKVPEPWASSRLLTVQLCQRHHRDATDTASGRRIMRWAAHARLLKAEELRLGVRPIPELDAPDIYVAMEAWLLRYVNELHDQGISPPHLEEVQHP